MKRKLVKQGAATLMVSIPAKWAKQHKLDKGSEVEVEEFGEDLLVTSNYKTAKTEADIRLSGLNESLIRTLITNTYRKGYDKIKVYFDNEKQYSLLKHTVQTKLIGFDIMHKKESTCIVENITEPTADRFEIIIEKLFLNIEDLMQITSDKLQGIKDRESYEEIEERILQYDNFCKRILAKKKSTQHPEFFWTFLTLLTHGQREIYYLNKILKESKNKRIEELFEGCKEILNLLEKVYQTKDVNLIKQIHELQESLTHKKGNSLLRITKGDESLYVHHIISATRIFYQASSPLVALIL